MKSRLWTRSSLQKEDGSFAPAHILADSRLERAGRAGGLTRKGSLTSRLSRSGSAHTRSAALLIVGDEILAAKVRDSNTGFLCAELRAIGWRVGKARAAPATPAALCQTPGSVKVTKKISFLRSP